MGEVKLWQRVFCLLYSFLYIQGFGCGLRLERRPLCLSGLCCHLLSVPTEVEHLLLLAHIHAQAQTHSREEPIYLTVGMYATQGAAGFSNIQSLFALFPVHNSKFRRP